MRKHVCDVCGNDCTELGNKFVITGTSLFSGYLEVRFDICSECLDVGVHLARNPMSNRIVIERSSNEKQTQVCRTPEVKGGTT